MLTFILVAIITTIISFCFFKDKFGVNRYLVLLIICGVAFVATLATNFIVRGNLQTRTEIISTSPLYPFYVQKSLFKDYNKSHVVLGFNYYDNHDATEFFKNEKDSLHKQLPITILFYAKDTNNIKLRNFHVGTFCKSYKQDYDEWSDVYIAPSESDTIAYRCKKKLIYDIPKNKSSWLVGFSLPRIKTITILYIPPKEYKLIPDSLITKIPF